MTSELPSLTQGVLRKIVLGEVPFPHRPPAFLEIEECKIKHLDLPVTEKVINAILNPPVTLYVNVWDCRGLFGR